MKFFHISDLHLGLRLYNRDLTEDQEYILDQICQLAREHGPEAVIIAGDIYDKAIPSAEAVGLFDRFADRLRAAVPEAQIMMISGNHDSAQRLDLFRGILKQQNIHMIGLPPQRPEEFIEKVTMTDEFGPVNFYLLPFVKPSTVKEIVGTEANGSNLSYDESLHRLLGREQIDEGQRNVLVSHQFYLPRGQRSEDVERMDSELCTVGNIDQVSADVLEPFDYAALGHIHKPMKVGSEYYRYCGTPLPCSVSEAGQQKAVLMVELKEKGDRTVTALPLKPLRQIRLLSGLLDEVEKQACDDYVTVELTDQVDLDPLDLQDRLRTAFPHLLEIRRRLEHRADYSLPDLEQEHMDSFQLCSAFLGDLDPETEDLLQSVINEVEGSEK